MMEELKEYELGAETDFIEIETEKVSLLDNTKIDLMYEIGYKSAKEHLKHLT